MEFYTIFESDIGDLVLTSNGKKLTHLYVNKAEFAAVLTKGTFVENKHDAILVETSKQLNEYFRKERKNFSLPLQTDTGTIFQRAVWEELKKIPYGETRSYFDIAKALRKDKAVRAVGQANRANRIPIIIPCHRVIGKNRKLTGYAGNQIEIKEKLLNLEEAF